MITEPSMSGSSTKNRHSPFLAEGEQNPLAACRDAPQPSLSVHELTQLILLLLSAQLLRTGPRTLLSCTVIKPTLG